MQHEPHLKDPRYTHFVAEVVEGGTATLSFAQPCASSDDAENALSNLKMIIEKLHVNGQVETNASEDLTVSLDGLNISHSGETAEDVSSVEDICRVAREMPTKLGQQLNKLQYKLLPLAILVGKENPAIRKLDADIIARTSAALRARSMTRLKLDDLTEQDTLQDSFPKIKQQILNFQAAFGRAETECIQSVRRLLPELRDDTANYNIKMAELDGVVTLSEQRARIAEEFIGKKCAEASVLDTTIAPLLAQGFENHLVGLEGPLVDDEAPRLLLSFGGTSIGSPRHPLQRDFESTKIGASNGNISDSGDDDLDDNEEWFENQQTVANVREACAALRQQYLLAPPNVTFGVAAVNKAYRPGKEKQTRTSVGDIVLHYKGKLLIVTGMLPTAPTPPTLKITDQSITVSCASERNGPEGLVIPTTGFTVSLCPQANLAKDGAFPRATGNEAFTEIQLEASETTVQIEKLPNGFSLLDDCDYEVKLSVNTVIGRSEWSKSVVGRTHKLPSVASKMIDFYLSNKDKLSNSQYDVGGQWQLCESGDKKTLYPSLSVVAEHHCRDPRFKEELAVRIVDVADEFNPDILASPINDAENTIVAVFAGSSGHGKSTQINAFVSYLLGGETDDYARIMIIDDRGANQAQSVTQFVTCYCIRPLSPLFEGKTFLIVDTPGYGDARGFERDAFVTAAMSVFFKTIEHVNAIIFTCRFNEARTTFLSPVSTYVFSLFAKDVKSCLRTIYTFSDAGVPLARGALKELQWPIENGEVEVNNAAFTIELDSRNSQKVRDWWLMSVKGQYQVLRMLLRRSPVPTAASASVTNDRLVLEQRCEIVERKIFRTANDAQNLIANLGALANAVGAAPGEQILVEQDVSKKVPVKGGNATTLCLECNYTCHEICSITDNAKKRNCFAMSDGRCTVCRGHCSWDKHENAQHIIVTEKQSEWVVPDDLIKRWNDNSNTLEGALLDAMRAYLGLQVELRRDILFLASLTAKLMDKALLHDPAALLKYIETLIQSARARGAPPEQIIQMTTAKKTLLLVREVKEHGVGATRDSQFLLQVLKSVQKEMKRRMALKPHERAKEERKPCNLYNDLYEQLPTEIKEKAPEPLKSAGYFSSGARYPENLQAVVKLVQVVLRDGGVVAALEASR